jgi:hypothetical protein
MKKKKNVKKVKDENEKYRRSQGNVYIYIFLRVPTGSSGSIRRHRVEPGSSFMVAISWSHLHSLIVVVVTRRITGSFVFFFFVFSIIGDRILITTIITIRSPSGSITVC